MNTSNGTTTSSRKWWALGALTLSVLAIGMDATILSVALPTLATALQASESDLQWFIAGYMLVLAAAMLPAGLLGDRYGRKRVMIGSLALFAAGSAACALAPSPAAFIAARAVLGAAGAGVIVMALSALTVLFSEEERPRAVGVWAAANFLALPIGPLLGGWLLTHAWWGWVFLINVPVALLGLVAGLALVPESRAQRRPGIDTLGILASTTGLAALTYGLIEAGRRGWGTAGALVPMLAGLLGLAGFWLWEQRLTRRPSGEPLVDVRLFRSRSFRWGVLLQAVGVLAMLGALFILPQYFQAVLGTDAMGSGLRLLPLILGLVVGAVPADRIAARLGAKAACASGFTLLTAGLALGATTALGSSFTFVAVWMALVGAGMGLAMATAASAALADLHEENSGIGSAVLQAVNKLGGPLGSAILGSALTAGYLARLQLPGLPAAAAGAARQSVFAGIAVARQAGSASLLHGVQSAFVHGMDVALLLSAGIAVLGIALTLAFLPARAAGAAGAHGARPLQAGR